MAEAAQGKRTRRAVDQSGRPLGPRALETRGRLLAATASLLEERSLREISVVEIARTIGASPATFYQYFKDVDDATLQLADLAESEMPALLALLDGSWKGAAGLETARRLVDGFVSHWDAHRAVLRVRNLAAEEGDRRFQRLRRRAMRPLLEALAERIQASQAAGRASKALHPYAAAAALASILERMAAYHRELETFDMSRDDLVETCARIVVQTLTGRAP